ncbi:DUF2924 domain-containing protein [Limnohabitans sp.]|uniref:DUF2924 domain-containing protein n=1 Tax=Limnohabitans sp. TaxID=1907725 RepID=UPI00311D5956
MKTTAPSTHASIRAGQISEQIAELSTQKMSELWTLWDRYFPHRPSHPNRKFIESRLAYKLQEIAYGAMPETTRAMLADYGERLSTIKSGSAPTHAVLPGTTLLRDFAGEQYKVTVLPNGLYEFDGKNYKSLSAIAKLITGTQWSGPAFFGLKGKKA